MGSISTIIKGSSEYGAMSYIDRVKLAVSGTEYEKKALGIVNEKARIHKETILNIKKQQNERVAMMNKPIYDTKQITKDMFKTIEQSFVNVIKNQQTLKSVTLTNEHSNMKDVEFIPILTAASSQASNNQAIKKPISKKKNKKETDAHDEYFIDENKDVDLMLYWELQKELNIPH